MYRSSIALAWLLVNSGQYAQDRARCRRCHYRAEVQEAQNNGMIKTATSVMFEWTADIGLASTCCEHRLPDVFFVQQVTDICSTTRLSQGRS